MKKLILLLAIAAICFSQDGQPVRISDDPSNVAVTQVFIVNGSNQTTAICSARSLMTTGFRAATSVSISAATNANPAVFTSTGHGFPTDSRPSVTISGGTGSWAAVNGTFTATVVDADTYSIPVDSTTFGALAGTVIFQTTAPRTTVPEWAVQKIAYDISGNAIYKAWLNGVSSYTSKCSDASSTTVGQQ